MGGIKSFSPELQIKARTLEVRLYVQEHARLVRYLQARHSWLDSDRADYVSQATRRRYIRVALKHALGGDTAMLETPEKHRLLLYGRLASQSVIDERRRLNAEARRMESIEETLVGESNGAGVPSDHNPYIHVFAKWCEARLPLFFKLVERGVSAPIIGRLRGLACEFGCDTLAEEFRFIKRYLFYNKSDKGDAARAMLTRKLDLFPERTGNTREVAICKLRKILKSRWREAETAVFSMSPLDEPTKSRQTL